MKKILPFLALILATLASCTDKTTTTTPSANDSTNAIAADSTPKAVDTAVVAEVLAPAVDTPAVTPPAPDNGKKVAETTKPDPLVGKNRLTVSFISIGGGIDSKAKTTFDKFVLDFGKRNKVKIAQETVGWGREGEVDYCFKLTELKELQKAAFVEESKALMKGNNLVQFKENTACRVPRK